MIIWYFYRDNFCFCEYFLLLWGMKNVWPRCHVINWHFLLFIVTIFVICIFFLLFEQWKLFRSVVKWLIGFSCCLSWLFFVFAYAFTVWAIKNVSLCCHVINWLFLLFIVNIFIFEYAFTVWAIKKCFPLLSRDYLAFRVVYRDYFCFCICFLLFEQWKMFGSVVTWLIGISCCLSWLFLFLHTLLLFER